MRKEVAPKTAAELGIMQGFPPERIIDMANWDKGPDCRWAFQHISEIIPTANISRGLGPPTVLPSIPRDLNDLVFTDHAGEARTIGEMLVSSYTDGFIVLQHGNVVFERYFNGMSFDTRHLLMSVSKSITGAMAGQLLMDGRLTAEAPVVEYIPELKKSSGYAEATVRHVLDMTVSLVFNEDYDDPEAEVKDHEEAMAWRGRSPLAERGVCAFAQTIRKAAHPHGEKFFYASINADVLAWLIERASGQRYIEFMSEGIWSTLGAERDAQISVDYLGSAVANGGLCITLRDMARFGQMMLENGFYNEQQILSAEWVEDTKRNGDPDAWKAGASIGMWPDSSYSNMWPDSVYRNMWYMTNDDHASFFGTGVNGQHLWINPTTKVVIAKFSSHPMSVDRDSGLDTWRAMDAIARKLGEI